MVSTDLCGGYIRDRFCNPFITDKDEGGGDRLTGFVAGAAGDQVLKRRILSRVYIGCQVTGACRNINCIVGIIEDNNTLASCALIGNKADAL